MDEDIKAIRQMLTHKHMRKEWKDLKVRVWNFMNQTRRNFGSAVMYLLEKGLEACKDEFNE